jgi:fumarate reductase flavoprotein subunit
MLTESIRNQGGILLNTEGRRFTGEANFRDVVAAAILSQNQGHAALVFNQAIVDTNANVQGYADIGLITPYSTLEEVAGYIGAPHAVVRETMEQWNRNVANRNDPVFDTNFDWNRNLSAGPWYALFVAPGIHHTMGGVRINDRTEVLTAAGNAIPGLFAAGEVTGGIHGGNRIGGNAILDILFFGRIAGENAAAFVN